MVREIGHFIGGKHVAGTSGRFADIYNPSTGAVQARVALATKAELRAAVENAVAAQLGWGATNPQRRARVLLRFLELVNKEYDSLAQLLSSEPPRDSRRLFDLSYAAISVASCIA
jgi:malonate-semialdehyde dehydrogenase (acetylating)/methylmalonate-semialdehyde dehydrogenase